MPLVDREARNEYHRDWEKSQPREYHSRRKYNWSRANPEKCILGRSRDRAKSKGIFFSITEEDIVIPLFCPVFPWIKIEMGEGKATFNSPSLDRIRPELGYVPGNVRVISHRANMLKSDMSLEEARLILKDLENRDGIQDHRN